MESVSIVRLHLPAILLVGSAIVASGCGAEGEVAPAEGRSEALTSGAACASHTSITLSGNVEDWATRATLDAVDVCAAPLTGGTPVCSQAAHGTYHLDVPSCSNLLVTFTRDGYQGVSTAYPSGSASSRLSVQLVSVTVAGSMTEAIGLPLDRSRAQPVIAIHNRAGQPIAGAALEMTPANGVRWYFTTDSALSTSLAATTTAGMAGFTNVDVGSYELHATAPGKTCAADSLSVPGSTDGSVVIQALAAKMAIASFVCD